jgi:hypothetical protein
MDMLGKVRRMKMRDKLSIGEISKRTGLSRNTLTTAQVVGIQPAPTL